MNEPLFTQLNIAQSKMLDEACKEVKNHLKIAHYAREVSELAQKISDREIEKHYVKK